MGYTRDVIYFGTLGFSYTPQELRQWLPKIQKLDRVVEKTFIFANNHWRRQAVSTIRQLWMILD